MTGKPTDMWGEVMGMAHLGRSGSGFSDEFRCVQAGSRDVELIGMDELYSG